MKFLKTTLLVALTGLSFSIQAQNKEVDSTTAVDKNTYYRERAKEDAKFEQQFEAKSKAEDEAFWEEQEDYENNLKRRDRKAYRAYMKGKRDAYAEHYKHCEHHHHSDAYYSHATFYYYRYNDPYYRPYHSRSYGTSVRVNTPSLRVGIF